MPYPGVHHVHCFDFAPEVFIVGGGVRPSVTAVLSLYPTGLRVVINAFFIYYSSHNIMQQLQDSSLSPVVMANVK